MPKARAMERRRTAMPRMMRGIRYSMGMRSGIVMGGSAALEGR